MGLRHGRKQEVGQRQNFPPSHQSKQQETLPAARLGRGPLLSGTGAGPSWRPSALLILSPLAKGTERSCGPAKLSGELGDAAANAQRGVNYLNICFPHGY